jgi:NAD(P)-dependent dehydrogenase (short-subunit alcohol dehydrogenase family)
MSVFAPNLFKDQVWLITGGGTGIGLTIAMHAAALGAKIAICGRKKETLEGARDKELAGHAVLATPCDIRSDEEVERMVKEVLARFGRIDVLVNNAGGQFRTLAEDCKPKGFDAVVRNNLLGTWRVIYYVANLAMIPQQRGSIVNIIAQVRNGFPGMIHTGAARAGVDNLTKTAAVEWAGHGIRVNAVAPGAIWSSGTARYPREILDLAAQTQPIKRLGTVEEVANVTLFLAGDASAYTTGQTFYVDGGQSLSSGLWATSKL